MSKDEIAKIQKQRQDLTAQNLKDSTKKGVMGIFGGKK